MSKAYWYGLSRLPGIGGATFSKLLDRFGSAEAVFEASDSELLQVPRVTERTITALRTISLTVVEEKLGSLAADGIDVLTWEDESYPTNLKQVNKSPPILYVRGRLDAQDKNAVAIVGTRSARPTFIGLALTLGRELAERGLTIVSGLAKGIDTAGHKGALEAGSGRTLAVLGSGLKAIHPKENERLAERIQQRGALLSELAPRVRARGSQLMARDRIISGLSRAVIVVEAGLNSGSMDTADRATKQGRLLYAIPGSPGCDQLLEAGVKRLEPDRINYDALAAAIQSASTTLSRPHDQEPQQLGLDFQ